MHRNAKTNMKQYISFLSIFQGKLESRSSWKIESAQNSFFELERNFLMYFSGFDCVIISNPFSGKRLYE